MDRTTTYHFLQRVDRTESVRRLVTQSYGKYELMIIRIEDAFDPSWWLSINGGIPHDVEKLSRTFSWRDELSQTPKMRLQQFIGSLPTSSAISYMISHLSRLLLLHAARHFDCSNLLLGDSLTSLSVSLISAIAAGDGFHVRSEREEKWDSITIVKPLREVTAKECAAFFRWRGLHTTCPSILQPTALGITKVTQGCHLCRRVSIPIATNYSQPDFIIGLDRDFPSTVNAIVKTCAKLIPKEEADTSCVMCLR